MNMFKTHTLKGKDRIVVYSVPVDGGNGCLVTTHITGVRTSKLKLPIALARDNWNMLIKCGYNHIERIEL